MYYLFANVVPNFTVEDAENIFSKFQVFVAVFTFALPIIIIIIFVSVFVTSFRRTLNTSFGVKDGLNIVKKFTNIKNIKLKCKDCGKVIDLQSGQTINKCPSCQGSNFKAEIEK